MYAVVQAGARQFKVTEGQTLVIDRIPGEAGAAYTFDKVLMVGGSSPKVGVPTVAGAKVAATIKSHQLGEKLIIFKYKRRKSYKRRQGHRQPQTVLEIGKITV
jgi:large subunit ribosomal protein L21